MIKVNRYSLYARYFPGLISIIPVTLIYFFLTARYTEFGLEDYVKSTAFLFGVSGTLVLTYFISMVVRELGCYLERKYYISKQGFPTTYLMLYSNERLPRQTKALYGQRISNDFRITRLTAVEEVGDPMEAVRTLNQASKFVSTKYQQHEQVKDTNIAYGFSRNTSGGLFISIPSSLVGIILGWQLHVNSLMLWSGVCLLVFLMLALYHKHWIRVNSEKYAEKVFAVYLGEAT
jgi:hypothetical protein